MRKYKVYTAGYPKAAITVVAASPKDAACLYFRRNTFRNSIVVENSRWSETVFLWSDIKDEFPDIPEESIGYRTVPERTGRKMPWWKDYFRRLFQGEDYYR